VTRTTREGIPEGGWLPRLAVSVQNALRHYTIDGAFASFEEREKGSITAGKLADIAVLSEDVLSPDPAKILKARVLLTIMDGRVVYRADGF
jgi:predicted amidohydrolase YtcJ